MGKGKGNVEGWNAPVKPGRILFEVSGCSEAVAREAMSRAANKLCLRCKFLSREGEGADMKSKEIRELTDAELVSRIGELRREKLNLKIQLRTGQLEKTARCRTVRRDIARCLTEQTARAAKAEVK
jgi:ribosomal protein L29